MNSLSCCVTITVGVGPHADSTLRRRSSCAMNVTTAAAGATEGAPALLHPQVTNIPSAFTKAQLMESDTLCSSTNY